MNPTWICEVVLCFLFASVGRIDVSAQHVGLLRGSVESSRAEDMNFQQSVGLDIDVTHARNEDLKLVNVSFWSGCYQICQAEGATCGWLCVGQKNMWHPLVNISLEQMNDTISSKHLRINFLSHCWDDFNGFVCVGGGRRLQKELNFDLGTTPHNSAGRIVQHDDSTSSVAIDVTNTSDDDLHLVTAAFWPDCYQSCGARSRSSTFRKAEDELTPTLCGYICVGKTNVSHPDANFTVHQTFDKNWSMQEKHFEISFADHCWYDFRGAYVCV